MNLRQMSIGSKVTILIGGLLIFSMLATELLSSSQNGIGPYQAMLMLLGLFILLLGIFPSDHWASKIALLCVGFVVSVMLLEGMLLVLSRANVSVTFPDTRELLDDETLGKRTPPGTAGHDARGWRNEVALEQADIVTIGDSQTWGVNALLSETYPSQLSELSGHSVYSMAQGSYGAVQYRVLAEQAIELSPKLVVVGMYFGNDFLDAYSMVYGDYAYQDLRNSAFDTTTVTDSIAEQVAELIPSDSSTDKSQASQAKLTFVDRVRSGTYIGKFLTSVGVFDAIDTGDIKNQINQISQTVEAYPDFYAVYQSDKVQTFFTPAYRQFVIDLDSPLIQEGIRISKDQYIAMQQSLSEADIELLVIFIPTKEYVYAPYIEVVNESYALLAEQESVLREDMMVFFDENQIAYVDTLPALQLAVEEDIAIYPPTLDGHPNNNGYQLIAEVIADFIAENQMIK